MGRESDMRCLPSAHVGGDLADAFPEGKAGVPLRPFGLSAFVAVE